MKVLKPLGNAYFKSEEEVKLYKKYYEKYYTAYAIKVLDEWNTGVTEEEFVETIRGNHGFKKELVEETLRWLEYIGVKKD